MATDRSEKLHVRLAVGSSCAGERQHRADGDQRHVGDPHHIVGDGRLPHRSRGRRGLQPADAVRFAEAQLEQHQRAGRQGPGVGHIVADHRRLSHRANGRQRREHAGRRGPPAPQPHRATGHRIPASARVERPAHRRQHLRCRRTSGFLQHRRAQVSHIILIIHHIYHYNISNSCRLS